MSSTRLAKKESNVGEDIQFTRPHWFKIKDPYWVKNAEISLDVSYPILF